MGKAPQRTVVRTIPRQTTVLLLLLGAVMSLTSFAIVMTMPDMMWHPARDAELRATYEAYQRTGTLLVKETGSGSYGVQAPAPGPLTFATWDDDPGSYIVASIMGDLTRDSSPYPGLKLVQALLVALPLVWLPLTVARVVGRARAGFAIVLLPLVVWMFNHGTLLVGTEYGLSDRVSTLPVYSLYGTAASLAFLSLSLIVLLSTYRLRIFGLLGATVGIAVLAAAGNLSRSLSGIGVAMAVGVLWWIWARGRSRWFAAIVGVLLTVLLATGIQTLTMNAINLERTATTGQAMEEVPDAHTVWHSLYLGLSYPQPLNGQQSRFNVTWSDEFGWAKAREVDPDVLVASEQYDEILKELYIGEVTANPMGAVVLYVQKAFYLLKHFGAMVLLIAVGLAIGIAQGGQLRRALLRVLAIATPLLLLGLVPAIMVMPMLYYYSELAAVLGLLSAIALGVISWALLSWPSRVRAARRSREGVRIPPIKSPGSLSVIYPMSSEGGSPEQSVPHFVDVPADAEVTTFEEGPMSRSLRDCVLAAGGARLLIVRAATPPPEEWIRTARESDEALVVMVAGARSVRARLRRIVLDSRSTRDVLAVAVDGEWVRRFAALSQEPDEFWLEELVYAAQRQGIALAEVTTTSVVPSRTTFIGNLRAAGRFVRISLRKDEYGDRFLALRDAV